MSSMLPTTLTLTLYAGMFATTTSAGQVWITTFVPIGYRTVTVSNYPSTIKLMKIGTADVTTYSITGVSQVNLSSNTINIRLTAPSATTETQCTIASTTSVTLALTK